MLVVQRRVIGLFGGTFDPIHIGHLRMALELKQFLRMDEMRLMPCHIPLHRQTPAASAADRAAMVELAVAECPELTIERLELNNSGPSYSLNTLQSLRQQLGPEPALCLAMGMDSLAGLGSWHQWERLLDLAHITVAARPGWPFPANGAIADYIAAHRAEATALRERPGGSIVIAELSLLPISATGIREATGRGESSQFLVPDSVWAYILRHGLYRPRRSFK